MSPQEHEAYASVRIGAMSDNGVIPTAASETGLSHQHQRQHRQRSRYDHHHQKAVGSLAPGKADSKDEVEEEGKAKDWGEPGSDLDSDNEGRGGAPDGRGPTNEKRAGRIGEKEVEGERRWKNEEGEGEDEGKEGLLDLAVQDRFTGLPDASSFSEAEASKVRERLGRPSVADRCEHIARAENEVTGGKAVVPPPRSRAARRAAEPESAKGVVRAAASAQLERQQLQENEKQDPTRAEGKGAPAKDSGASLSQTPPKIGKAKQSNDERKDNNLASTGVVCRGGNGGHGDDGDDGATAGAGSPRTAAGKPSSAATSAANASAGAKSGDNRTAVPSKAMAAVAKPAAQDARPTKLAAGAPAETFTSAEDTAAGISASLSSDSEWLWPAAVAPAAAATTVGDNIRKVRLLPLRRFMWVGRAAAVESNRKKTIPWGHWTTFREPCKWEKTVSTAITRYSNIGVQSKEGTLGA